MPELRGLQAVGRRLDLGHRPVRDGRGRRPPASRGPRTCPTPGTSAARTGRISLATLPADSRRGSRTETPTAGADTRKTTRNASWRIIASAAIRFNWRIRSSTPPPKSVASRLTTSNSVLDIGHRVHQLEHPQIPRRFAAPQIQRREDVVNLSAEHGDRQRRSAQHHGKKAQEARSSSTSTPQHVKTKISKTAAARLRHHHNKPRPRGKPGTAFRPLRRTGPSPLRDRPASVLRGSAFAASPGAAQAPRRPAACARSRPACAGSKSQSRSVPNADRRIGRFRKWNSEACPNRSRSSAVARCRGGTATRVSGNAVQSRVSRAIACSLICRSRPLRCNWRRTCS